MAVYFVPAVAPLAYPMFYDLCDGRLPESFWEWRAVEDAARRDLVARGHHVVGVPLAADEFRYYCRSANCAADAAALSAYATRIGNDRYVMYGDRLVLRDSVLAEDVRARRVVVDDRRAVAWGTPPRRHWWQFWRPAAPRVVVEEDAPAVVERFEPRRHWWQFWRPRVVRTVEARQPLAARPV